MIETERLILRKFTLDDVDDFYEMNKDARMTEFTGDGGVQTKEVIRKRVEKNVIGDYEKYGYGRLAVVYKPDNKLIGFTVFHDNC